MKKELKIKADIENLDNVLNFLESCMDEVGANLKTKISISVACEEIYVNIAHYAYPNNIGYTKVIFEYFEINNDIKITFLDNGLPFNPMDRTLPDTTLSAEEREIGGLGILMVKKSMDNVIYVYENNNNNLSLIKKINK